MLAIFSLVYWFLYTSLKNPCAAHLNIKLVDAMLKRLVVMTSLRVSCWQIGAKDELRSHHAPVEFLKSHDCTNGRTGIAVIIFSAAIHIE